MLRLGGSCEAFVGDSDGGIKSGVGGLDGGGEVSGERSVVLDACELFNPDCQRFNPWISKSWSRRWVFQVKNAVCVAEVVVIESGASEVTCPWQAILLVREVVLLTAELWGVGDSGGQVLWLDVLDVVFTGAKGHVRGAGIDGGGVDGVRSIELEHVDNQGGRRGCGGRLSRWCRQAREARSRNRCGTLGANDCQ